MNDQAMWTGIEQVAFWMNLFGALCLLLTMITFGIAFAVALYTRRTSKHVAELVRIEHARIEAARRANAARVAPQG